MTNHLQDVYDMLGPGPDRPGDPAAWLRLEQEIGRELPADYKSIIDAYAPVQLHWHLYLTSRADLGEMIRDESQTWNEWRAWESRELAPDEDPRVFCNRPQIIFGTPDGLIPLADTDQGARIYLAPEVHGFPDGVVVQGPDGDWAGHPMTFAEWLHRYLSGEEMAGWGSAAHYPGPVLLEYPASEPGQPPREVYGPERGM
ncbi:SMI1/KNR4 family protein [Streptomyces virginiae]|uniref:SMI1/KNR4 family protein n=1 Tax=Streptomyces virginiae TaxID=1961 RepID=UPI002E2D5729|nr:SMI1/KNR4 family protein [Streptomyces virginiae]